MTATSVSPPAASSSVALRWYVLIIMMISYAINIADRYVVTTVMEQMRLDLHLNDGQIAFLTGVPLALFYCTLGIPISWLADISNRRNILSAAIIAWSAMTTLCGLSQTYMQFLLARIGVGVGEAGGTPPANSIVADYFPAGRRAMAMTIFALGAPVGAFLGANAAGYVAAKYGWHSAFLMLGIPGALLGVLIFVTIKEPARGRLDIVDPSAKPTFMQSMSFMFKQKAAIHVIMGGGVSALWGWGLMWFTPTFLQRAYHLGVDQAANVVGPIHLVAGTAASLVTAWLLSLKTFTDPRKVVWLLAGGVGLTTIPSFLAYYTHDLSQATLLLWIFIPAIYFYIGPAMALLQNLAPPKMRATFIAVSLLVANVLNLIVAPQSVGWMSDYFAGPKGADAESLRLALMILAPTGFWAAWHYWAAGKTIVEEQKTAIGYI